MNRVIWFPLVMFIVACWLGACDSFGAQPFWVVFSEDNPAAQNLEIGTGVYRGGFRLGKVREKKIMGDDIGVGIVIADKYRDKVTRDSKFYIDDERGSGKNKARILVLVPYGSHDTINPGDVLDGGVNSDLMWQAYLRNKEARKTFSKLRDEVTNSDTYKQLMGRKDEVVSALTEFSLDLKRELTNADWSDIGNGLEHDILDMQRQVNSFLRDNISRESLAQLQEHIDKLQQKIAALGDTPEVRRLSSILNKLHDKLSKALSK